MAQARNDRLHLGVKTVWGLRSAGEQYHAEGLYKDRSAFIPRSYNGSTALKREKVRGGERSASG